MSENKENSSMETMSTQQTIGLWAALGYDHAEKYTNEEMVEILSKKINSGEISQEELRSAIELVTSKND